MRAALLALLAVTMLETPAFSQGGVQARVMDPVGLPVGV